MLSVSGEMSTTMSADLESGYGRRQQRQRRRQRQRHRHSMAENNEATMDGSLCFSGSDYDDQSCRRLKAFWEGNRKSLGFPDVVDLESGDLESKAHSAKYHRDCRILPSEFGGS
ncbi:hypothetical protein U1Q18_025930 [Sarracenia purpurea var. burkii]